MAKIEEVTEFDPNEGAKGPLLPNLGDGLLGIKAATADQYVKLFENQAGTTSENSGTIAKALDDFAKAIKAPPSAYTFGRASIMPDPSAGEGILPWPGLSPDAIGKVVQENLAPQLIIGMRVDDVLRYSIRSIHPWRPGWRFELKEGDKTPSTSDRKDMLDAEKFLQNSNVETSDRKVRERDAAGLTNFQHFLSALTRDSLTYDGIAIWTDTTVNGAVKGYTLLPAAYIRLVDPNIGYHGDKNVFAVQLDQGGVIAKDRVTGKPITFTRETLTWYVRNPRVDPYIGKYGYSEIEIGVRLIQGFQNAIDLNVDTFNKSGIPNGILLLKGGGWVQRQLDVLMRMWTNLKRGITKVWSLPVIATPPDGEIEVLNLNDLKGTDVRYQDHMNMMVGAFCTVYRFPTHRLGYRVSGKGPDTVPLPDSQARIIDEDDPGLTPLLTHIENVINEYLVWPRWPHLRFAFTGKSPKEDAREYEFRKNAMTLGEARAETDLPELEKAAKGDDEKFLARIMSLTPLDPNLSGVFQTVAAAMVKAKFEGSTKDAKQPGNRMTSARDPARTEGHGYPSGVRRRASAAAPSATKARATLYVSRLVENADEIVAWARGQGFAKTVAPDDLHVTVAFSRTAVDWGGFDPEDDTLSVAIGRAGREVAPLGDEGAIVLKFRSRELDRRWKEFCAGGCSWDHDGYRPHVTITYAGDGVDLAKVEPYTGEIVLGPERFAEVVEDWEKKIEEVES